MSEKEVQKQLLDLPYDCLGEIFYFFMINSEDFFSVFLTCKELSNLVCKYTENVRFNLLFIKSFPFPKKTQGEIIDQEKSNSSTNIFLAVQDLYVDFKFKQEYEGELIECLKCFKNIRKISFGSRVSTRISNKVIEIFSKTRLKSLKLFGKSSITSVGLSFLPESVTNLYIAKCTEILDYKFLNRLKMLKKINVSGNKATNNDLIHFPKSIIDLNLSYCENRGSFTDSGAKILLENSVVEVLDISSTRISNLSLSFLPKTLIELNISFCQNITDEGIMHLSKTKIKKLNLSEINLTKVGFSYLPKLVEDLTARSITSDDCLRELSRFRIKKLDCGYSPNSNLSLPFLPSTVKVLDMRFCGISCLDSVSNFNSIENLDFSFCVKLNDNGIKKLENFENLKKLILRGCNLISNRGLWYIPKTLKELDIGCLKKKIELKFLSNFKNLESLNVSRLKLDDEDLKFIPQSVSQLILLKNKKLTNVGMKNLNCLEILEILDLESCSGISDEGLFYILEKAENLEVVWTRCSNICSTRKEIIERIGRKIDFF